MLALNDDVDLKYIGPYIEEWAPKLGRVGEDLSIFDVSDKFLGGDKHVPEYQCDVFQ